MQIIICRPRLLSMICFLLLPCLAIAQHKTSYAKGKGPNDFPLLNFTKIAGAPDLNYPVAITGSLAPVIGAGAGWAAPLVFDWDGDGKKDLLVGEFQSGLENAGLHVGDYVRIYSNVGTDEKPAFTGGFLYAWPDKDLSPVAPLSIYTWCCMGFTPRVIDLDKDGYPDILTGQFNPGDITWFRGSENGFLLGEKLEQAGRAAYRRTMTDYLKPVTDSSSSNYWVYSAVDFGDFDDDGLADMIVGGGALRMSKNIGTAAHPVFGYREMLLDINEQPVYGGGDSVPVLPSAVPYVVDWDGDSVLDLLVTCNHSNPINPAVTFFRGLKTSRGHRFEHGIPLFTNKSGGKTFPGSYLNLCVTDWNNDGIKDLLIGAKVPTIKGRFQHHLAWSWEKEADLGKKNPAYNSIEVTEYIKRDIRIADSMQKKLGYSDEQMRKASRNTPEDVFRHYYGKKEYMNLAHQGYVYILLGKK